MRVRAWAETLGLRPPIHILELLRLVEQREAEVERPEAGRKAVPKVRIRYVGMKAFGITDGSGDDEIFFTTSIVYEDPETGAAANDRAVHPMELGTYKGVDEGYNRNFPVTPIYRGVAPSYLTLMVAAYESDEDAIVGEVVGVASTVGQAIAAAYGYRIPPEAVKAVDGQIINLLTDTDELGMAAVKLDRKDLLRYLSEPMKNEDKTGINYHFCTLHTGEGSTYKFYFDVIAGEDE